MQSRVATEDWLWLLGSVAQLHGIAFDAALVQREFPPPLTKRSFIQASQAIGLVVATHQANGKLPAPCVAWLLASQDVEARPSAHEASDDSLDAGVSTGAPATWEPSLVKPALIVRADKERLLYFVAGSETPQSVPADGFGAVFEPELLLLKRSAEAVTDPDAETQVHKEFGFRWFLPEFLKHKDIWRDVLIVSAVMQVLGLTTPLLTQVIIDKVIAHQTMSTLTVVGVGLGAALLFSAGFGWLRQYLLIHTGNRIDAVLGSTVFSHLLRLPLPYFQHRATGVLIARLRGVETIREFLAGATVTVLLDLPFMVVLLAVMFIYSWQLSLVSVGLLIFLTALSAFVTPILRVRLNEQFLVGARNQAFVTEYTAGIETVKSLQLEPRLEARYGDLLADYLAAGFKTRLLSNTYNTIANALEQAQTLCILVAGALLVMRSEGFTIGMLVAFQMFSARLSQPVLRLVSLYQELQQTRIAVQRLGDIMNMPTEPHTLAPTRVAQIQGGARVELQEVSFRYGENAPWLYRNLNLMIPPGRTVAVMGPSGSGKSTLAKLFQAFYLPQEGRIKVDGADLRTLPANLLRSYFGIVPQETILFSGTIYENLQAAQPHATFEDIATACRMAEIHEYIESLPAGYQTEIGERGAGLSGGQRQRIAIARALLKRPRVLIFDESTSNLDDQTTQQFARTINQLKGTVTMIFIAHQIPRELNVDGIVRIGRQVTLAQAEGSSTATADGESA